MRNRLYILVIAICSYCSACAWKPWPLPMDSTDNGRDSLVYKVSVSALASSGNYAPFWLQSNRFGDVSSKPFSGNINAYFGKAATRPNRWFDYDFGVEIVGRVDTKTITGYMQQLYAHTRLYVFDISAGIQPVIYGNPDNELGTGGLVYSGNAHPLPRISIGIDKYTAFPFTYGYLEIKGGLTHAWVTDKVDVKNYFIHHKYIGGQLGGKLPVHINYEFHHFAQWGGHSDKYGNLSNNLYGFMNALLVRSGGKSINEQFNAEGNHIIMQAMGVNLDIKQFEVSLYWQSMLEDGPFRFMGCTMNAHDGLWGISFRQTKWKYINGICYEFLNTTHQSGPFHDRDGYIFGGADNYFNNNIYRQGWSYFSRTIGTPFITSPLYNKDNSLGTQNNRVRVHHIGVKGNIYGFEYRLLASYTRNWGRYVSVFDNDSIQTTNTALMLEVKKHIEQAWGIDIGIALSSDFGNQFGNDFGAMITISKHGICHTYR